MVIGKLHIDVVHGCGMRCVGCPNSVRQPKIEYMTENVFGKCLCNIDVKRIETMRFFNFGDPLLHPNLRSLVNMARYAPWKCHEFEVSTSGQYLNDNLKHVIAVGIINRLVVSCDGDGTPEDYERWRPPAKWDKLMAFLKEAARLKKKFRSGIRLRTRTICKSESGRKRWLKLLLPLGFKPEFRGFIMMPERSGNPLDVPFKMPKGLCRYLRKDRLYVDYDGTMVPCCVHPRAFTMGNLTQMKYSEMLVSPERNAAVARMRTDRKNMEICSKCGIS